MSSNAVTEFRPPLLRTKISVPRLPGEFVHRSRLTDRINQGVKGPLTLLAAPAGFGKTNLLIEWVNETSLPVAWLTLDNDDNDLSRFFRYLIGALQTIEPGLGEEALDFSPSSIDVGLDVGLTLLINEITALSKEIALVLDDFQVLENPAALQSVGFLLKYLSPNLHLVIASRSESGMDLAFLRAKGRVVELGADDLRFSREEIVQYFQQTIGVQPPPETIQAMQKYSDGWITSLQMAAISLKNQADPESLLASLKGEEDHLADFLAEEVLDRQPEEIRQFLIKSSILETFNGPLCEAVVKPDAQHGYGMVMLNRLENANLFLTALDENHEWFHYHHVFAGFLRRVQEQVNPDETPELHKRAAIWLERNGRLDEAYRHALASQDLLWAADMIERNLEAMINTGEISALTYWIGKLPDEIIHQRMPLGTAYAWALIAARQLDLARYWVEDVKQMLDQLDKQPGGTQSLEERDVSAGHSKITIRDIRGGLAVCQSILAILNGNLKQAAELAELATRYFSEENVYLRSVLALHETISCVLSGDTQKAIESARSTMRIARRANNPFVMIVAANEVAIMQMIQGQLSKAWETIQKAKYLAVGTDGKPHPLSGFFDIVLGEILMERDLLNEARDYLERGCQALQPVWYLGSLGGLVSLARVRQGMGDISGAQAIVEETARMALSSEAGEWDEPLAASLAVRLAVQRDDLAVAEQWWKKSGFRDLNTPVALEAYPYHIYEYILLAQIRFLLGRGLETGGDDDIRQVEEMLEPLLPAAKQLQRGWSQIQILILQAMAQSALGEERAAETLMHALALGEPEGFRRFFLDEGGRLGDLLRQCRSAQEEAGSHFPSLAFIDSLLESIQLAGIEKQAEQKFIKGRAGPTTTRMEDGLPISLSAREMEVLVLIAEGKSNQEISAQLYLALNTVKRHVYNIFAKLQVKKRTQAVSKARQLGLIP